MGQQQSFISLSPGQLVPARSGQRQGKKDPAEAGSLLMTIFQLSVTITVIVVVERADVVIIEFHRRSDAIDRSKLR